MGYSQASIFTTMGASSHSKGEREANDYYATSPDAVRLILKEETFENVLEPACGEGHISKELEFAKIKTTSTDLIDRGFGGVKDFFRYTEWDGDIVTNPPYKYALDFVEHAINIIPTGRKIAMFLKLTFLESKERKRFFLIHPPKKIYVCSLRITCAMNGDFEKYKESGAIAYAWFVWIKGNTNKPIIDWIN